MKFITRNIKPADYDEVCDLGAKNYPQDYYEGKESFTSKIEGCYEGCLAADLDGIIGYIISFPYKVGKAFPIDSFYEPVENPNCWYIHDVCVSKDFRKMGVAKELTNCVIRGKDVVCLTAVMNSEGFWSSLGFRSFFNFEYCGLDAKYMILIK
jgi:ribosomal protein S18 acetylase RimI-like enzyme